MAQKFLKTLDFNVFVKLKKKKQKTKHLLNYLVAFMNHAVPDRIYVSEKVLETGCLFIYDILEWNTDYSDTLDFGRVGGGGDYIFCFGSPWLQIRNVNILVISVYV